MLLRGQETRMQKEWLEGKNSFDQTVFRLEEIFSIIFSPFLSAVQTEKIAVAAIVPMSAIRRLPDVNLNPKK